MHLRAVVLIRSERMVLLPCESYCLSIETRSGTGSCYAGQSKIKQPNKRGRFALRESGSFRAERHSVYVSALQDAASANANDGHYADNADKQKEGRTFIAGLGCLRLP